MTVTNRCPACRATYWVGARHICPRPAPPPPGSRLAATIALWTFAGVVCLVAGWALNSVFGVF